MTDPAWLARAVRGKTPGMCATESSNWTAPSSTTTVRIARRLEGTESLSPVATALGQVADAVVPEGEVRDAARGRWLGHPVHPMLTDLPIGFWTSAFVLDLVPPRSAGAAADILVALGLVTAVPTVLAGLAELTALDDEPTRRAAAAHALGNAAGSVLYACSLVARRRGHRARGVVLGWGAAGALTFGGYLGGHLTYRRAAGVSPTA
jgi:uncharacterized membrane protein